MRKNRLLIFLFATAPAIPIVFIMYFMGYVVEYGKNIEVDALLNGVIMDTVNFWSVILVGYAIAWVLYFVMGICWVYNVHLNKLYPIFGTVFGVSSFIVMGFVAWMFIVPSVFMAFYLVYYFIFISKENTRLRT